MWVISACAAAVHLRLQLHARSSAPKSGAVWSPPCFPAIDNSSQTSMCELKHTFSTTSQSKSHRGRRSLEEAVERLKLGWLREIECKNNPSVSLIALCVSVWRVHMTSRLVNSDLLHMCRAVRSLCVIYRLALFFGRRPKQLNGLQATVSLYEKLQSGRGGGRRTSFMLTARCSWVWVQHFPQRLQEHEQTDL